MPPQPGSAAGNAQPESGFPAQQGFGSFGYPPPSADFGPPPYPAQPGFGPPPYPTSGWVTPQAGQWGDSAPYPPSAAGFQPGFAPATYGPPGPGPGLQWGGVRVRLGALLIDAVIVIGVLFVLSAFIAVLTGPGSGTAAQSVPVLALSLGYWLFALIYHPACWYIFEGTPGQKLVGLRVVRASDGQSLGIGAVLARYLIFFIVTVLVPLGIISGFMTANDPFRRAWHDQLARSVVVRRL